MAPVTRSDINALEHILTVLLGEAVPTSTTAPTPFRACFATAGVTNASDFSSIDPAAYSSILFTLKEDEPPYQTLNVIQVKKLGSLQSWFSQQTNPTVASWFNLDFAGFQAHRMQLIPVPVPAPASTKASAITDVEAFRKGVRRNISDFKPFKEDRYWYSWQRHLLTTARSQNIEKVFDLSYQPTTASEIALLAEQQRYAFGVLEHTVTTSDGLVFIRIHSASGDATKVYSCMVDRYSKSTAALLAASELEEALSTFRLDSTWKKSCLAFLNTWTTKVLDLDNVLIHPTTESQKRIWFVRSIAPKALLAMSISQFEASEKLTKLAIGISYVSAPFSTLYDHVKDDAIRLDQTERIQQLSSRRAHKTQVNTGDPAIVPPQPTGTTAASDTFIGRDGYQHAYLIPPARFRTMTQAQREAELLRIKTERGQGVVNRTTNQAEQTTPPSVAPPVSTVSYSTIGNPTPSVVSYATMAASGTPSVVFTDTPPAPSSTAPAPSLPGGNLIRQILSANTTTATVPLTVPPASDGLVQIDGNYYRRCNMANVSYTLSTHNSTPSSSSLMDGGANGGMTGSDVRIISTSDFHKANVSGIGNSTILNLPLVTAAGLVQTHRGPVIIIMHQYANYGKGHTIHSATQLRSFGALVHEAPRRHGGLQRVITPCGYHIPLSYRAGLPYLDMSVPSDSEYNSLPHVLLTGDTPWDPSSMDDEFSPSDLALDAPHDLRTLDLDPRTTDLGGYTGNLSDDIDLIINHCRQEITIPLMATDLPFRFHDFDINKRDISTRVPNLELLRPNFGWIPIDRIKQTIKSTTQFARASERLPFRKHFRSRFPACNVHRWNEDVATDTFFCDTPAHDDGVMGHGGCTMAQLYVGKDSSKTVVYPMHNESEMATTLEDLIRRHGAPNGLFSDNARAQCGKRVLDILRLYTIKDFQCEPHQQHQNFAERKIGDTKRLTDSIMDRTGTPAKLWLLCLLYVVFLMNHLSSPALDGLTPIEKATGQRPDISPLLNFHWYEEVLYADEAHSFPSQSREKSGRWVGIAETKGDALTYHILTDDTHQLITRSAV
jgi:hypothetical protein